MKDDLTVLGVLHEGGVLSSYVNDFQVRIEQQRMALFIEEALKEQHSIIIEAGTGTGKTFAYLVPVLLSDHRVIISTGTKNLQDQLFHRDVPLIHQALNRKKHIVLLKGRANYICLYRLNRSQREGRFFSREAVHDLELIRRWVSSTQFGDISEVQEVAEDASVWSYVTSTAENCLSRECPFFKECYLLKARMNAQKADVLIVNHHLFMADWMVKEEGFGELLPGADVIIFDEAHQLQKVATRFFSVSITSRQLLNLHTDIQREYFSIAKDDKGLKIAAERFEKTVQDFCLVCAVKAQSVEWVALKSDRAIQAKLSRLLEELDYVSHRLESVMSRSKGLENCWRRSVELYAKLNLFQEEAANDYIQWAETTKKSLSLHLTPIEISESFQKMINQYQSTCLFTSATIAVKEDFHYFKANLGLNEADTLQLSSPFDYERQALLYLPKHLPDPNAVSYTQEVVQTVLPVLEASQGRAFFLFTSFRALYEAEAILQPILSYPLLVQGSRPKRALLDEFRLKENAVLLGTQSFWEGVDVRGEALSCVIIDKLPFSSPTDPVLQARIKRIRQEGRDPFQENQLPQAVISLKQGVGRLIRDQNDRGVLVICDPRLLTRSYGSLFLNSLPRMRHTRVLPDVQNFFETK